MQDLGGKGGMEGGEVSRVEIRIVMKNLREAKAVGEDGIPNEVWKEWKYGGEEIEEWMWRMCNKVWREEGWAEDWKLEIVVPVLKKGKGDRVEDYRGIALTQTGCKVYAAILTERVKREIEEKEMLPPSQTGFREGMEVIDNIYVLNYLINRQIEGKKGENGSNVFGYEDGV